VFGKSIFKSYSNFINFFARISDPFAVVLAAIVSFNYLFSLDELMLSKEHQLLILVSFFSAFVIFPRFNMYGSWRGLSITAQSKNVLLAWSTILIFIIVILFSFEISYLFDRQWLGLWAFLGIVFIMLARFSVYYFLHYQRKHGKNLRQVLIVGAGVLGKNAADQVKDYPWTGYQISAFLDDDPKLHGTLINGIEVKGCIENIENYLLTHHIDEVWIALPFRADERTKQLLFSLRNYTVYIKLILDIFDFNLMYHSLTEVAGLPAVNLTDSPMTGSNRLIKAIEDRLLAIIILILIFPLMLVISLIIKLSNNGSVLYRQERVSWNKEKFMMLKFRTMSENNESDGVIWGNSQSKNVTKFGRFLRKTSLDELPQFLNVLKGDMSIVGPRPERTQFVEKFKNEIPGYMQKHMVKAGITGWAQVNGWRGDTCLETRIEYDLNYIDNWSLLLDLKIILLTILNSFKQKNVS